MLASAPVGVLSRYLLARFIATFGAVLTGLALLVGVLELLADFGDVMGGGGFAEALTIAALRVPHKHLPLLIPIAAFAAAYLSVGSAARAYEILAMKAGGLSPLRMLAPILVAAVLISGFALLFNETLALRAYDASRRIADGDGAEVTFRRGSFWYHKDDTVYNVRDADPAARELRDVAIFELDRRGRLRRSILARRATIGEDGRWRLSDAVLREFRPDDASAPPVYQRLAQTEIERPDDETALLSAGVSDLSIRQLREYRSGQTPGDTESVRAEALLHERMAQPLASLLFVVLALPLGLRVEQTGNMALPALQGLLVIFAFFMLSEYGGTLATQGVTSAAATPWTILAAFLAFGAWRVWRAPR